MNPAPRPKHAAVAALIAAIIAAGASQRTEPEEPE